MGQFQEAVEGVLARVILLEGGGSGAGLQGILQTQVAPYRDEGLGQLRGGQGAHGMGHAEAIPFAQQHGGEIVGHKLAQPFKGMDHHAFGLLTQGEQGPGFFHQAGASQRSLEIRSRHGHLLADSRHFEKRVKQRPGIGQVF